MRSVWIMVLLSGMLYNGLYGQNGIRINRWINGVSIPVDIAHCNDERLFVIEKVGKIRIIRNNALTTVPFLDIASKVRSTGGEQGLLGMAFHPDYKKNGLVYVNYTDRSAQTLTVIEEYKLSADTNRLDSLSGRVLLTIPQPYANHNGGCIKFGPDGFLYIGMGDGGSANDPQNNAQNKMALLGKMLRIDVNATNKYNIPPTNPFVANTAYAPEIWAVGMRNPWRFSFDRLTGDLWIGDVGQGSWEEVDFEPAASGGGRNYGWRCYEGNANFNTNGCEPKNVFTFPVHEYFSDENINGCSVTGGYVYRGDRFPGLYGKYIYGDYCSGKIWSLHKNDSNRLINTLLYDHSNNGLTTFGEDAEGNLYFADASLSAIFQIWDTCTLNVTMVTTDVTCPGLKDGKAQTNLSGNPVAVFQWSTGDTTETIDQLSPGAYRLTLTVGNCRTVQEFIIRDKLADTSCIKPPFTASFCEGDSTVLVACEQPNAVKFNWFLNGSLLPENSERLIVLKAGEYSLSFVDSNGCQSLNSNLVQAIQFPLPPKPEIHVSRDTIFATPGYAIYRWYRFGVVHGESMVPFWWADQADGNYKVQVVDSNGCASVLSDSVAVVIPATQNQRNQLPEIYIIPNPVNDQFTVKSNVGFDRWCIFDLRGRAIAESKEKESSAGYLVINVEPLIPGPYLLRLIGQKQNVQRLFLKE